MAYTKVKIEGVIEVITGLHIGGDDSFSAIGAIDSPVVRDPITKQPIIPGSTIKGKMRSLLAREMGSVPAKGVAGPENDCIRIKRLFGSSASDKQIVLPRLQFSDCFLLNKDSLPQVLENKFENSIDRLTAIANPRQIERVVRGAQFGFEAIYNIEEIDEIEEDFSTIKTAITLLENDYLGGGGTRGNGRVAFTSIEARPVTGDLTIVLPSLR